jgi:hypothetical protein
MTTLLAGKMPPWLKDKDKETKEEDKSEKDMKEKKKASEVVDASVLDTAEVDNDVNLSVGGQEESTIEATRASLVEFISSRLGKKL